MSNCVFCFRDKAVCDRIKEDAYRFGLLDSPEEQIANGTMCSYGFHHDFGLVEEKPKPKQVAKPSKDICTKCGLHKKNPAYGSNGCAHEHRE